jgi:hypothetical protein
MPPSPPLAGVRMAAKSLAATELTPHHFVVPLPRSLPLYGGGRVARSASTSSTARRRTSSGGIPGL